MYFNIACNLHPKYKAIKFPVSGCQACIRLYNLKNWRAIESIDDDSKIVTVPR